MRRMPLYGVGPLFVGTALILTFGFLFASHLGLIAQPPLPDSLRFIFALIGPPLMIAGAVLWYFGAVDSRIQDHIRAGQLVTTGAYTYVRHPIYAAFLLFCTGVILYHANVYGFILPPMFWLFLTLLMRATEEKWMLERFGEEYADYCRVTNRVIPWRRQSL